MKQAGYYAQRSGCLFACYKPETHVFLDCQISADGQTVWVLWGERNSAILKSPPRPCAKEKGG